jgi:hypothetical protein
VSGLEPGSFHLVAAALRADAVDVASLARVLTTTLGDALPAGTVDVDRERSLADRLAGRPGSPVAVRVQVPDRVLVLQANRRGQPVAEVHQVVRGVVLSRRPVGLDEWVGELASELTRLAERNAAAREALERLLGTPWRAGDP